MARRNRRVEYAPAVSYDFTQAPQSLTVLGAVIWSIITIFMLITALVTLGPTADWFTVWLMGQTGNPYASIAMTMFSWWYIFILASGAVTFIVIWRAAIFNVEYGRNL